MFPRGGTYRVDGVMGGLQAAIQNVSMLYHNATTIAGRSLRSAHNVDQLS